MALKTAGSAATNTLTGLVFQSAGNSAADQASFANSIQNDAFPAGSTADAQGFFSPNTGQLFIPNRGVLKVLPGDYILTDPATGWPILVSARAIAGASWVHS